MKGRKLTENEIILAKKVFSKSIKYEEVNIYAEKFAFFQPNNSGMTPNGNIYTDGITISNDYGSAVTNSGLKAFFIHEMVHVWQKQNNVLNPIISAVANSIRHAFFYKEAYKYTLDRGKDLLEYRIEQQAQIIEDYAKITIFNMWPNSKLMLNKGSKPELELLFIDVLFNFINDPSYARERK